MGATNHTTELVLPQFVDTDKPTWRGDINDAMLKIDNAVKDLRRYGTYRNVKIIDHAAGDGIADDTDEINAGIAALSAAGGGVLYFPHGTYNISALISVPKDVQLFGDGGKHPGVESAATRIKATNAAAGLQFKGSGNGAENIQFDGNNIATQGITVGSATVAGDRGAFSSFRNVVVMQVAGNGWQIYGAQNGLYERCNSINNTGHGMVLDYSPGGNSFVGLELSGNSGCQLLGLNTAAGALFFNVFIGIICEYGTVDLPRIRITAGNNWRFYGCNLATQLVATPTQPVVDIQQGQHLFDSTTISLTGGQTAFKAANGAIVTFSGQNAMSGFGAVDTFWFDGLTGARAVLIGEYPTNTLTTNGKFKTATTTQTQVGIVQAGFRQFVRDNASFLADYCTTIGDTFNRHERYMNGAMTWGSGAAATDLTMGRNSAGVLEVSAATTAGAAILGTLRHRQSLTVGPGAAYTVKEPGLFDQQIITLNAAVNTVITGPTYADGVEFMLIIGNFTGATYSWAATFKFPGGTAPTPSANGKIDIFTFRGSLNNWYCIDSRQNF